MTTAINTKLTASTKAILESLRSVETEERTKYEASESITTYGGRVLSKEAQLAYFESVYKIAQTKLVVNQMSHFKAFYEMGDYYNAWSVLLGDLNYLTIKGVAYSFDMPKEMTIAKRYWFDCSVILCMFKLVDFVNEGGFVSFHRNGQVDESSTYSNGLFEGEVLDYYEEGELRSSAFFIKGERNGYDIRYYKSGGLMRLIPYTHGNVQGEYNEFYPSGNLKYKSNHVDGESLASNPAGPATKTAPTNIISTTVKPRINCFVGRPK
jgi:antitoxin component YwqK of YwqJK toxin-antitoxin module